MTSSRGGFSFVVLRLAILLVAWSPLHVAAGNTAMRALATTDLPTGAPSGLPTPAPTIGGTSQPTARSRKPTLDPAATRAPTMVPTRRPITPKPKTSKPTAAKPKTSKPTKAPTLPPTASATLSPTTAPSGPNFLYILADDLGYGEVSIMPNRTNFNITTPNIDRLFTEGMRFTHFYANQECAPSRGSLMTGKHLGHSTVRSNDYQPGLQTSDVTFLELLRDVGGYKTSCIGKWHLAGNRRQLPFQFVSNPVGAPWNQGCEHFFGVESWSWYYPASGIYRYKQPGGLQESLIPENVNASRGRCMAAGNTCVWLTDLNLQEALSELDYHKARQDAERAAKVTVAPFFIYLAWTDPHAGVWVDDTVSETGNPVPGNADFAAETSWPYYEMDHAAAVHTYHDNYVQTVLNKLDALGLRNDTVVIFSSDNGAYTLKGGHDVNFFASGGPLQGSKGWLTDGGTRVAAAIRWPGKITAGTLSEEPLALWDLFPTILDIAGVPQANWPAGIDGVSFWNGVLQQQPATIGSDLVVPSASFSHPPLYWESCTAPVARPLWSQSRKGSAFSRAIRQGKWKGYMAFLSGTYSNLRLYDITIDPGESNDVSASNSLVVASLTAYLNGPDIRTSTAGGYNYTAADACDTYYGRLAN